MVLKVWTTKNEFIKLPFHFRFVRKGSKWKQIWNCYLFVCFSWQIFGLRFNCCRCFSCYQQKMISFIRSDLFWKFYLNLEMVQQGLETKLIIWVICLNEEKDFQYEKKSFILKATSETGWWQGYYFSV